MSTLKQSSNNVDLSDVIKSYYRQFLTNDAQHSVAIATLKTLMKVLEEDKSKTVVELRENVRKAIDKLKQIETCVQVESVSEIFLRFITLYVSRYDSFDALKKALSTRSELFLKNGVVSAKESVAKLASKFIAKETRILMHSRSMTVLACLKTAHKDKKDIFVYVTESRPDSSGREMCDLLSKEGIKNQLIMDASIGIYLEKVDMVMVGAEGVCASGGILNKVGTYPLAICARAINKPFYVVAESYKFIRMYPLNQSDVPDSNNDNYRHSYFKKTTSPNSQKGHDHHNSQQQQHKHQHHDNKHRKSPSQQYQSQLKQQQQQPTQGASVVELPNDKLDYTPPAFITLILTDLGPLTTAAISDELMKIYL